jgi:hypothetical protein
MRFTPSIFGKLLEPIKRRQFDTLVERHAGDAYVKSFASWNHLLALVYAQFGRGPQLARPGGGLECQPSASLPSGQRPTRALNPVRCQQKVHSLAGNPDHHLVQVPSVARARTATPQPARDHRSELQHPAADSFVGDVEPTLGEKLLHVSIAERKAQVEPNGMLDDIRRKAVTVV